MKHLIARHDNSFVVGLKDQAFLVLGNEAGSVIELLPSPDTKAKEPKITPQPSESENTSKETSNNEQKQFLKPKVHDRRKSADEQLNEICAVAVMGETNALYCAVARNNKAMQIYNIKLDDLPQKSTLPSLNYRTPKRVSSFAFANIPTEASSATMSVLVSVDLAGDSYAYNLNQKGQRLLLGHTASMLTDVAIAKNDNNHSLLFTCDRDEKIRISRFPESYVVEGFLLGHTAFVSGFVVLSSALGVSCGGDMSLRLWDLKAQEELSSVSTSNDENSKEDEIPIAIAASSCGSILAVIFDDSKRLSIYKVNHGDKPSLELLENVDCLSQPLSIVFNAQASDASAELTVLMKDPEFVAVYNISKNDAAAVLRKTELGVLQALKTVASEQRIAMPSTILEKDDFGNPVLRKTNETRGPGADNAPWNRVERIEIHKEREKRRKKQKIAKAS